MNKKIALIVVALLFLLGMAQVTQDWFTYPRKYTMQDTDLFLITNDGLDSTRNISWATIKAYILDTDVLVGVARLDSVNEFNNKNTFLDSVFFDTALFQGAVEIDDTLYFSSAGALQLPTNPPHPSSDGIWIGSGGEIIYRFEGTTDTLATLAGAGQGGVAYLGADQEFTGTNAFKGILGVDSGRFVLPRTNLSTLFLAEMTLIDSLIVYNTLQGDKIIATQDWVNNASQVKIDSMKARTNTLGLDYWGTSITSDSSWRAQLDSNFLKIDSTTYVLDPFAFYVSGDTLYIDTSYIGSGGGSGSGDMLKSNYDPASIVEQLVGVTANQSITNKVVNGVTLTTGGAADQYLNAAGGYSTPSGTGTGEANLGQNLGSGFTWYTGNSGVYLQFKSIIAGTGLTATSDATSVTINMDGAVALTNADNNWTVAQNFPSINSEGNFTIQPDGGLLAIQMTTAGNAYLEGFVDVQSGVQVDGDVVITSGGNLNSGYGRIEYVHSDIRVSEGANLAISSGIITVDVTNRSLIYLTAPTGLVATITNFTGGSTGQELEVIYVGPQGQATIQDNSNLHIAGNFAMQQGDVIKLRRVSAEQFTGWVEVSRSNN